MTYYKLSLSDNGLDFIKGEEFFVPHSYQDSVLRWTFGYGSTYNAQGDKVGPNEIITEPDALALLKSSVMTRAGAISALIRNPLNQNQQDAILSLVYNIGVGGFTKSTVLKLINQNPMDSGIEQAFWLWNKGTDPKTGAKIVLPGLTARRARESALYFKK